MAIINEIAGQSASSQRGRREYFIEDVTDAAIAYSLALSVSPSVWEGLYRQDVQIKEKGADTWRAIALYSVLGGTQSTDPVRFSFDIGTASVHITHAIDHIEDYPGTAVDHEGAIGVQKTPGGGLTYEGVDVLVPVFTWEETHNLLYTTVSSIAWLTAMEEATATTNDSAYRIWDEEELIFLGVSGQSQALQDIPVTFRFGVSRTKTNITIGGDGSPGSGIENVDDIGWQYLWNEFEPIDVAANDTVAGRIKAVHTERVYPTSDFSQLGLPDPWN